MDDFTKKYTNPLDDFNVKHTNPLDEFIALSDTISSMSNDEDEGGSGKGFGATSAENTQEGRDSRSGSYDRDIDSENFDAGSGGFDDEGPIDGSGGFDDEGPIDGSGGFDDEGPVDGSGGHNGGSDAYRSDWDRYRSDFSTPPKKSHKGLMIFLCILVIAALAVGGFFVYNNFFKSKTAGVSQPYLAKINIVGTIESTTTTSITDFYKTQTYNQNYLLNTISALEKDKYCKGIIVYLNTPGGSVYATDEVYLKLMAYKQNTGKPVYAVMGPTCASGGYYIACAADKIFADRNTTTGSIGVTFGTMFDISGLLEKYGIKTTTITSGANKGMGSEYTPMTEEQRQIYQSVIDEAYIHFTGVVAEGRHMTNEEVWAVGDGRIFTAQQALDNRLIDQIAGREDSLKLIKQETGVNTICDFAYVKKFKLKDLFVAMVSEIISADSKDGDLSAALKLAESSTGEPYYIMN